MNYGKNKQVDGGDMPKARETVTWSNHIEQEAIVRQLINKGIITQKELVDEVQAVQSEYSGKKS